MSMKLVHLCDGMPTHKCYQKVIQPRVRTNVPQA